MREVLDAAFTGNEQARGYVLDDQAGLRRHMAIFVDGAQIRDRVNLSDPVSADAEIGIQAPRRARCRSACRIRASARSTTGTSIILPSKVTAPTPCALAAS